MLFPPELHSGSPQGKESRTQSRTVDNLRSQAKEITFPIVVSMKGFLKLILFLHMLYMYPLSYQDFLFLTRSAILEFIFTKLRDVCTISV